MSVLGGVLVRIDLAGAALPHGLAAAVTAVEVDQALGRPAQCRVTLAMDHADPADGAALGLGTALGIRATGHPTALFEGEITGRERSWHGDGGVSLVVRAHDRMHHLRAERRTAAHVDAGLVDVARVIAARHGLDLDCDPTHDPTYGSGPAPRPPILQYGESDLALLRRLCARSGLFPTVRGGVLHLVSSAGLGAALEVVPGRELVELSVDERCDPPVGPVRVVGADLSAARTAVSGAGPSYGGWLVDDGAAADLARSLTARAAASGLVATGLALGDPRLRPATPLSFGSRAATRTTPVITRARHRIDAERGYLTEFSTESTDPLPAPAPAALSLGSVIDIDDPAAAGRVRVTLGAYEDLDTGWIPVVSPGAGNGKGVIALPAVGDTVLLAGPADDPGRAVVLGGLWGTTEPSGRPVSEGRSLRYLVRMPGGGLLSIDDEDDTVRIANGAGSHLELGPDRVRLVARADLDIDAAGRRILIRADAIDMERA